ncbi:MAG: TetR/AcrR family transcriptional regulator, partial [Candidatus Limnocylindria bacterium]
MVRQTDAGVTASTRKAARRRAPLNRERVLRAALRLADRGGIDSVSMRHLGQELGVEAMTLYHYVASKDELLEGMVDLVTGEIELPSGDGVDWKVATRRRAISAREAFRRHPWASLLWIRLGIGPAR